MFLDKICPILATNIIKKQDWLTFFFFCERDVLIQVVQPELKRIDEKVEKLHLNPASGTQFLHLTVIWSI